MTPNRTITRITTDSRASNYLTRAKRLARELDTCETTTAPDVRKKRLWGTPQTQSHKLNELLIMLSVVEISILVVEQEVVRLATKK
jgi:hypothetical protein